MSEQNQKTPLRKPLDFPQLDAATEKDSCFDVAEVGSAEWKRQEAALDKFFEARKAGRIPKYPDLKLPGW